MDRTNCNSQFSQLSQLVKFLLSRDDSMECDLTPFTIAFLTRSPIVCYSDRVTQSMNFYSECNI